ncbi:UDP-glucose 4-epimerase GalE [Acidovorax cavernicola]|uniref:UDP-glucose 4-epimerase n=1 Tax=Acidovorax cavernicola TaxID=1675792 RepID=A0A9X8D4L0_9BURK|nr:UDP-glucose 4-epimerase GalE [Acidovorax cavernicola]RIX79399.1 UDP-glucose 4-epimerase GalE [Acidovorax cavernicola]
MKKTILVTGGAGYIGSHTTLALLQAGYDALVLDNLINSSVESLKRIEAIAGRGLRFVEGDILDSALLEKIFSEHRIDAVLHFAGLKSVGESIKDPLIYYKNNVSGTLRLCESMNRAGVFRLIFSSSATVYGSSSTMPISEASPLGIPTNPYGNSKLVSEEILSDLAKSSKKWKIGVLRYFNPIGAHTSGLIGEDPNGIPNNLLPYIAQVAIGKLDIVRIFGDDYPTPDGTGIRDYIHVQDLADGHLKALANIENHSGLNVWNLGTGQGYSVLQIIRAFEQVSGKNIAFEVVGRRDGDIAECWSNSDKALRELNWKAERGLLEMIEDAWRWQSSNPHGYGNSSRD